MYTIGFRIDMIKELPDVPIKQMLYIFDSILRLPLLHNY